MPDLELKQIQPNKLNPRLRFSKSGLDDLAASIKQYGILEPIIVRPVNSHYEVVVGERRYRAAQQAGLDEVPVIVRDYDDDEVMEINLVENVQREDLSAVEKAKLCNELRATLPRQVHRLGHHRRADRRRGRHGPRLGPDPEPAGGDPGQHRRPRAEARARGQDRLPDGARHRREDQGSRAPGRSRDPACRGADAARDRPRGDPSRRRHREPRQPIAQIVQEAVREPRASLAFTHRHYQSVVSGEKQQTTRRRADPRIEAGTIVRADVIQFADLEITDVIRKRLGELTEEDAYAEGGYTLDEFRDLWRRSYGGWNPEELVTIIRFDVARVL